MTVQLEFRLLGPLEVLADGQPVAVGGPRQRTVLAVLALSPDRIVSVDSLMEALWNGEPPTTGRTQVAICIASLRKIFRSVGCRDEVIATQAPGYVLRGDGHLNDVVQFERLVAQVQREAGAVESAALLEEAMGLWRGPVLAGVSGHLAEAWAVRLEEQRLAAYEQQAGLQLELGKHRLMIGELSALVREHPLREQARAHLMLAQYRLGRRADALQTFREGWRISVDAFGMELGPTLRELHDRILRDDPGLMPVHTVPAIANSLVAPAQLPADVSAFVGREAEFELLDGLLDVSAESSSLAVGIIHGPAGVGKSGLAVRWADRTADSFPDGQLFADLSGNGSGPVRTGDVLGGFLQALGVPSAEIPSGLNERAALFRSVLRGRRVLVLLDNAESSAQIQPLLPGNRECCLLVTSRGQLSELLSKYGPLQLSLKALDMSSAVQLLGAVAGQERVAAEPGAAEQLVELCDRLPLALHLAAARLASRPHWTIRHLVDRFADEDRRLDELSRDEQGVRASYDASYRRLSSWAALLYQRLGEHRMSCFSVKSGATLMRTTQIGAEQLVDELVDARLVDVAASGLGKETIYRLFGLRLLHAREQANRHPELPLDGGDQTAAGAGTGAGTGEEHGHAADFALYRIAAPWQQAPCLSPAVQA